MGIGLFFKKNEKTKASIKLHNTTPKPSRKIGDGEYKPLFDK